MFTIDNTEGFTGEDLKLLNQALEAMLSKHPGMDEGSAADIINNNWQGEGDTVETLTVWPIYPVMRS